MGHGVGVVTADQVAQVKVNMLAGGMDVDVEQSSARGGVSYAKPGFLHHLTQDGVLGVLARFDVASRLQPQAEALVPVEHGAARADDHGRGCYVRWVGVLAERVVEPVKGVEELQNRRGVSLVDGLLCRDLTAQPGNHSHVTSAAPDAAAAAMTASATAGTTARLNGDGMM